MAAVSFDGYAMSLLKPEPPGRHRAEHVTLELMRERGVFVAGKIYRITIEEEE